ncbi:hypothetical protein BST61_g4277 [Cercospora zeina]
MQRVRRSPRPPSHLISPHAPSRLPARSRMPNLARVDIIIIIIKSSRLLRQLTSSFPRCTRAQKSRRAWTDCHREHRARRPAPPSRRRRRRKTGAKHPPAPAPDSDLSIRPPRLTATDLFPTMPAADPKSDDNVSTEKLFADLIDHATFEQILEMDDDEDEREFSKSIVYDFFDQAAATFKSMHEAVDSQKLQDLSNLGHFLKGSSATLGLTKVKDSCEKIQHFGARKDETGNVDEPDDAKSLKNCAKFVNQAEREFKDAERVLRRFYHEDVAPESSIEESSSTTTAASSKKP